MFSEIYEVVVSYRFQTIIMTPSTYDFKWNMFRSFSPRLWVAIGFTMALFSVSLALINLLNLRHGRPDDGDYGLVKTTLIVVGAFCQTGTRFFPHFYKINVVIWFEDWNCKSSKMLKHIFIYVNSCSGPENREYSSRDPSRWCGTLYPQKLIMTSGGLSVDIVRQRTQATELSLTF
jgi:hypothetical protein